MMRILFCVLFTLSAYASDANLIAETRKMTLAGDWDEAISKLQPALQAAVRRHDIVGEAVIRVELGRVLADRNFFHKADAPRAQSALQIALRVAQSAGHKQSIADATQYLGQLHYAEAFNTGNWQKPRAYFLRAISLRQKVGDQHGLAQSYFYLGLTYEQQKQPATAMRYYQQSLALSNSIGDKVLQSYAHRHIGGLKEEQGQLDEAFRDISQSLELRRQGGFTVGVPYELIQKAEFISEHYGKRGEAIALLEEAIDTAEKFHSTRALSAAQSSLASLQLAEHNGPDAVSFLECALDNAREFGDPETVSQTEKLLKQAVNAR
jgi:tetratricopeptide (TPR) repeat protein